MTDTNTTDPNRISGPMPAGTAPAIPSIDTSEYDVTSSYDPCPKDGTYLVAVNMFDAAKDEAGAVFGWKLAVTTCEPVPDEFGKPLIEGYRIGPCTIFTSESQYRTRDECIRRCKGYLQGLNNLVYAPREDGDRRKIDAALLALDPARRTPSRLDSDESHYKQWINTVILATLRSKVGKDGVKRTEITEILARETPRKAK
jgi:hypothetical protein